MSEAFPQCECSVHRHTTTYNLSPRVAMRDAGQCSRNGRYTVQGHKLCKAHAKLFAEGHINPQTMDMTDPLTMRDIRKYSHKFNPFFEREVIELFNDEDLRLKTKTGEIFEPGGVWAWRKSA